MAKNKEQIIVKGRDITDDIRSYKENGNKIDITYINGKTYSYSRSNVTINSSALSNKDVSNCFNYLKDIAKAVGLQDPNAGNILLNHYKKIDFINENSMLTAFLKRKLQETKHINTTFITVYPFSFNISQKTAIDKALVNPLTIIEGPPGTGKTQTILNIIANAVMRGESVAVVSNNNSATANILEKLQKHKLDFIAAYLGNTDNKQQFIKSQKPLPDLSHWILLAEQEKNITQSIQKQFILLSEMLSKRNELSKLKQKLDAIKLEYRHFEKSFDYSDEFVNTYVKSISSEIALELWLLCEKYIERGKMPGFFCRIINRFKRGVINKKFYSISSDMMIVICQKCYYTTKISELNFSYFRLKEELEDFNFSEKMERYSKQSEQLFRSMLAKKYNNIERHQFQLEDLYRESDKFISEYPVILATTYSLRSSLSHRVMYDYVIVDEASQVDIVTGALALSCAKKTVIVGDLKQLPNVVDYDSQKKTDEIFTKYNLHEVYRYKNHSLLLAVSEMFYNIPSILLKEHYRCHPQIIEFCNKKFYDNQLIVLTEPKSNRKPLIVYTTVPGNHARERFNQRQIDVIKQEIIPQHNLINESVSVGIVTPYRNQTNALKQAFQGTSIQADTVDKFQGRENDVIILSTVDNQISDFTDNANRLNVAISRAIEQLIVVINGDDEIHNTNIGDLVNYIKYNNLEIIQSEIYSVFDYLYKVYNDKRQELLSKQKHISKYDSENLMYNLISKVLCYKRFKKFDVAVHVPLKMILRNMKSLSEKEKRYTNNLWTHVDFLIYDKIGKIPKLIVEVDGFKHHREGSPQAERDKMKNRILETQGFPFIRFKTTGSNEPETLISALDDISKIPDNSLL